MRTTITVSWVRRSPLKSRKLFSLPYFIGWHHCGYIRGLRREYIAALKRNDQKSIEYFDNKKLNYREGFFTEIEEPIEPILKPLSRAISNCETLHRNPGTRIEK
jgi:hypothetical protein